MGTDDIPVEFNELLALHIFKKLDSGLDDTLEEHYGLMKQFRERLFETWQCPLKRLDGLLYMCMETVDEVRKDAIQHPYRLTNKLNVTTRLHARCVQVGNEISHLLHGGFADGAFARWRTLHETSVITKFLCQGDEDLSTRFSDYQSVFRLKAATHYNEHNELQFPPITAEELAQLNIEQKSVIDKYEPSFAKGGGWASKALGKSANSKADTKFYEIESFVELSYLKNHFSFASQYVHAGIDSIGFKLGTSMSKRDILLTGPSNEGLIEPIQCASLSLTHATTALIEAFSNEEGLVKIELLRLWHETLKDEVVRASDALQAKGDALTKPSQ